MKLSLLSRRISHFSYRPPEIQRHRSSFLVDSVPNEVLSILGSSSPVEPALEALVPFLSSELVSSIIRQEPNLHRGFRFFIWAVQRKRLRSSLSSKMVLEMLAKENGFDLYWRALDEVKKSGAPIVPCVFTMLISGYMKMGFPEKAVESFGTMKDFECEPDVFTYNAILHVLMRKRNGLVEEAEQIFNEMERVGCFPSVVTFNALINGLCHAGNLEKANFLFYKMQVGRDPSVFIRLSLGPSRVHDSSSFKTMVLGLCESGRILKAYRILMQLSESGNLPDIITYNIMINGFCKIGNIDGALNLIKDLQRKGLSPDSITYGTLINGFQRLGREEEALGIFDKMVQSGIKPGPEIYRCLMKWSCHRRKVSSAFSLWLKYLKDCSVLDDKVLKETREHFEKGEVEKAVRGLAEMEIKLNTFSLAPYTILLIGFCWVGNAQEAFKIFSILKGFEVIVTPPSCAKLINTLCKQGSLDLATDIFLYTLENGFKLMPRICNYLLKSLLQSKGQWTNEALDILSRMESQGYDLDAYLNPYTKSLFHGQKNMWDMVKRAPG